MHLAVSNLFYARWSEQIHEEWIRSLLQSRPDLTRRQLERTRQLMDNNVLDCLVVGFERLIPTLTLPDADDRHVLATAITTGADLIVTFNLTDFPVAALAPHGIAAKHPDDFLSQLLLTSPTAFCEAVRRQRANLIRPRKSVDELLEVLESQLLPMTVRELRKHADLL